MQESGHSPERSAYADFHRWVEERLLEMDPEQVHFHPAYFKDNPVTHDIVCAVLDSGRDATVAEIGWHMTGDTMMFIPPEEWFGDTEPMEGQVTEEELQRMGTRAMSGASVTLVENVPVAGS